MSTHMRKKISRFKSKYTDQDKLNSLTSIVLNHMDDLYEYFGVKYRVGDTVSFSECFIHGGDNPTALNLYYNADYRPHYKCRTHLCENTFGTSVLSMIRGGLSRLKYNWSIQGDQTATLDETVDFLLDRYNLNFETLDKMNNVIIQNPKFQAKPVSEQKVLDIPRELFRKKVQIPSPYYLGRKYSKAILEKYEVGTCNTKGKYFYRRAVVPIYDNEYKNIIGFTGRSIDNFCEKCTGYHYGDNCPKYRYPKWKHSKGFNKEQSLYNYWFAKDFIKKSGVIIIVESPGNVWRLEEAGIHNSVAIYGIDLSPYQKSIIDSSNALSVILIMDNDKNKAGQKAANHITEILQNTYRVYNILLNSNDLGDMNTNEITKDIVPHIEGIKKCLKY